MEYIERKSTIGRAERIENNSFTVHYEDRHHIIIGFEVNKSTLTNPSYDEKTQAYEISDFGYDEQFGISLPLHHTLFDPGHTFMYLAKNDMATIFLSLGPLVNDQLRLQEYREKQGMPSQQEIHDMIGGNPAAQFGYELGGQLGRMHGRDTPDYRITERTFLFRILISETYYNRLYARVEKVRSEVLSGKENYSIFDNNTCAKAVRFDAIGDVLPGLPWGRSAAVLHQIQAINPYAFYDQMKEFKKVHKHMLEYEIKDNEKAWDDFIISVRNHGKNNSVRDIILTHGRIKK
ncbi:hypothetical protein HYE59_09205 [Aggregatibacter actinomycetemcomitans]|uniref:hypothetical protein n=1 Tax=Aggregatibacter actinomycetemcomitans TaxID=714 RepID=UPI00197C0F3E|nr:hypothetical protein [Aggregatibacter actinomycetemcomitans]MBN6077703.1 hypothetical protein [Aggregatibacter actinomycetemcomitans]